MFLVGVLLAASGVAHAQNLEWVRCLNGSDDGNDVPRSAALDDLGNLFVAGSLKNNNFIDLEVLKVSNQDVRLKTWVYKGYQSSSNNDCVKLAFDSLGNVFIAGTIQTKGNDNFTVIKFDNDLNLLWKRAYRGLGLSDRAVDMVVDGSGSVYVTGRSESLTTGADFATIKYAPNGDFQWTRRYTADGGTGEDAPTAMTIDGSGDVIVVGKSYNPATGFDFATVKYAPDGTRRWAHRRSGSFLKGDDLPCAVATDGDGDVYVFGTYDHIALGRGADYTLVKYNASGSLLWQQGYNDGVNRDDFGRSMAVDPVVNVLVTGVAQAAGGSTNGVTIRYGPDGNRLWTRTYDGPVHANDGTNAVVFDAESNAVVVGYSQGTDYFTECLTMKYAPDGRLLWTRRYAPTESFSSGTMVLPDALSNLYVIGTTNTEDGDDWLYMKYRL